MENRIEIKGEKEKDNVVNALLNSGYEVLIALDPTSEAITGDKIFIIRYARFDYDGKYFELVSEED